MRARPSPVAVVGLVAALFAAFYATCSLLIHASFHSNGWDLGLIEQVVWNTAHGDLFQYSFRSMNYAGDHWQPLLLVVVPLQWLFGGPESLLVFQAVVLAAAAVPLFLAVRRLAGEGAGYALVAAYLLSLGVARAVDFDFHLEVVAPLLAFGALWALATGRRAAFFGCALALLPMKEDGALLVLALCWIAWLAFGWRRGAGGLALVAVVYGLVVTALVMPPLRGSTHSPITERYGYLGDSTPEMALRALTRPDLLWEQLNRAAAWEALALLFGGVAFLPLAVPRLLPAVVPLVLLPLLSTHTPQGALELHYMLVPTVGMVLLAALALRARPWQRLSRAGPGTRWAVVAAVAVVPAALFLWRSPLPPSFSAERARFEVDGHAAAARAIVARIPADADVSAQSAFVAHLAERGHVYEFPRLGSAAWVVVDTKRWVPGNDWDAGYVACREALPRLGFEVVVEEDGITLWRRTRAADPPPGLPHACQPLL
ncbi:MAG: DUF2079 domain-containing protein [Dehalococcoidia bacterium]|nr:DUF2079 domain-containing protein [Dehalococcoidia bacterium]